MNRARILLYLARADFLERIRQYSFLFVLAATTYLGYSFYRAMCTWNSMAIAVS